MTLRGLVLACALAAAAPSAVPEGTTGSDPTAPAFAGTTFDEVAWPYPLDPWAAGRAFLCPASRCGREVRVAVRPKVGFCNCATGVADDDEIDRVSDLVLVGETYRPDGPGWPAALGPLVGRARRYRVAVPGGPAHAAVALAASRGCDVVVALVEGERLTLPQERAATDLLGGRDVAAWALAAVGG